jgi:nicotinate phosphoribosyltransferase
MFHTAKPEEVLEGRVTDVYFERTLKILKGKGVNPLVRAEFIAKSLPDGAPWAVFAGLDEALYVMERLPFRVRAMREGSVFYPYEPVMEIEARYQDLCVYETALLGLMCQASGVATRAARCKRLAGDRLVVSFGARRMHPLLAPMIERNAYVGGCDGVSVVTSGELIGQDPVGTIPHACIICFGSTVQAMRAYDEVIEPKVNRVALIDTFLDEKFECLNVAEALGEKLFAVRFDTPSSRRGDFYRLLWECRWELDTRGYQNVKFIVSGGIKEKDILELNPLVDGYGIGTTISAAPVLDFAMDIMEMDGRPLAKRGKRSGSKRVLECPQCMDRKTVRNDGTEYDCPACNIRYEDVLVPVMEHGKHLLEKETHADIRARVLDRVSKLEPVVPG